jgi:dTDP-4-dehydrorhamnose reductase
MNKIPVLGTGLNGLVGSRFVKDFSDKYDFDNLDLRDPNRPVDITNAEQIMEILQNSPAEYIVHFAAFTNVSAAWEQSGDKDGVCYQVNVKGTENIIKACQATGKHLIHISTAYVFDGEKETLYTEEDPVKPIEWYGETKMLAEKAIQEAENLKWTIYSAGEFCRISIICSALVISTGRLGSLRSRLSKSYLSEKSLTKREPTRPLRPVPKTGILFIFPFLILFLEVALIFFFQRSPPCFIFFKPINGFD